jgi:hypothetical protein
MTSSNKALPKNVTKKPGERLHTENSILKDNTPRGLANTGNILTCTENPIYVFPEMKLCRLVPNSYIHVSVSILYILSLFWLQQNRQTNPEII